MAFDVHGIQAASPPAAELHNRDAGRHAGDARAILALDEVRAEAQRQAAVQTDLGTQLRELAKVTIAFDRRLQFSLNEKLGQVVVKVIDGDTDKVIKEIPPAEIQAVHERIREVIGILLDERA